MTELRDPVLYIDCTSTFRSGLSTGVQRVVRALLDQSAVFEEVLQMECIPICYQFNGFYGLDDAAKITLQTQDRFEEVDFCFGDVYLCPDAFWTMGMTRWYPFLKDRGVSIATVVYDLIPYVNPEYVGSGEFVEFCTALREVVDSSDLIFCISDATRRDLKRFIRVESLVFGDSSIRVIPLAPALADAKADSLSEGLGRLPILPFFLMVGSLEPRRGYVEALEEFGRYRDEGGKASLLIVGKVGGNADHVVRAIRDAGEHVFWLDDASDSELVSAYKIASAVVCASRIEGYGMSVSEGLAYNGKVLANRLPVFGEFAGSLPYYFDINRKGDLARLLAVSDELHSAAGLVDAGQWSDTATMVSQGLADISIRHGRHRAIELERNSVEAVRWAHWLQHSRPCDEVDQGMWLAHDKVSGMVEAMRFESRQPMSSLSPDSVRWAQALLNSRTAVSDEEVKQWQSQCPTLADLRASLMYAQRNPQSATTPDSVRWLQLAICGREGVGDDEAEYWGRTFATLDELRNVLLQGLCFLDAPVSTSFVTTVLALTESDGNPSREEVSAWSGRGGSNREFLKRFEESRNLTLNVTRHREGE